MADRGIPIDETVANPLLGRCYKDFRHVVPQIRKIMGVPYIPKKPRAHLDPMVKPEFAGRKGMERFLKQQKFEEMMTGGL